MNEELQSLKLSKMVSLNKPMFWIYLVACIILYIYNRNIVLRDTANIIGPANSDIITHTRHYGIIGICAFTALFLELLATSIKNQPLTRVFTTICLLFEIISIVIL